MKDTLEAHYKIFDDRGDLALTVGPDSDGLDLVDIKQDTQRVTVTPGQALVLIKALERCVRDISQT